MKNDNEVFHKLSKSSTNIAFIDAKDLISDSHIHLDLRVVSVVDKLKVLKGKLSNIINLFVKFKVGERMREAGQLLLQGFNMVRVNMGISHSVNEISSF